MENGMKVPQKIKNRATIWTSNFTTEYIPKESETVPQRDIYTLHELHVHCSIILNSQDTETTCDHWWMNG